jgi:hypothetical protein
LRFIPLICCIAGCERGKKEDEVPGSDGEIVVVLVGGDREGRRGDRERMEIDLQIYRLAWLLLVTVELREHTFAIESFPYDEREVLVVGRGVWRVLWRERGCCVCSGDTTSR